MFDSTSDEFEPVKISNEIEPMFDEEIPENSQVEDRSQDLSKVSKDWSEDEFSKKTSENASSQASAGRKMDPDGPEVKGVKAEKMVVKAKQHVCDFPGCNLTFSRPSRLNNHMRIHTGDRPFVCDHCQKSYTRNAHLKRHIETNHSAKSENKEVPAFTCSTCHKSFSLNQNLQRHIKRTHTATYKCDQCDAVFAKNSLLKKHSAQHGSSNKLLSCSQCNRRFLSKSKLRKHKRVHDGYKCDVCEVVMDTWSDLTMHKKSHLNEPTELTACDVCGKEFSKRYLKMHKQIHTETRDVLHCTEEYCPRYFYFMRNLRQHIYSFHLGIKHPCTFTGCDKQLSSKQKLKEHIKTCHSDVIKEAKARKKPTRPRKDKGAFKKPLAAIMTRIEPENPASLINQAVKKPLEQLENIRLEAREYVGSTIETSDSEGYAYVGCQRTSSATPTQHQDRLRDPTAWLHHAYEDDTSRALLHSHINSDQNAEAKLGHLPALLLNPQLSSDTEDTDREPQLKKETKVDFSAFIKQ